MQELYLGIDLGTTNSKAAILDYRESAPTPTALSLPQLRDKVSPPFAMDHLPSIIQFDSDGRTAYVGEYARLTAVNLPDRTVRSVKRLMGKNWQHKVPGWSSPWTPQGIAALILKKIRSGATDLLHDTHDDLASVTVSVPASFGTRQREATLQAARLAGFSGHIRLIDEPSAALMHFIYDRLEKGRMPHGGGSLRVLVFDMGGGTLDVSIAEVESSDSHARVKISSRSRYTELAGAEFDLRLAAYVLARLEDEGWTEPAGSVFRKNVLRATLFDMAESLKMGMSNRLQRRFSWSGGDRYGEPFEDPSSLNFQVMPHERELETSKGFRDLPNLDVTFNQFVTVLQPFFDPADEDNPEGIGTIYGPVYTALHEADLSREDVDVVLMHGGMCELPLIQAALMDYFPESVQVLSSPNPMTSVAQGAALYHARERLAQSIEVEEPALFESVFYEHEEGFKLVVSKDKRVGEQGALALPIARGTRVVRLRLYQGFNETDPLLAHDRDLRIELSAATFEPRNLQLRWEINPNRKVDLAWQDPDSDNGWQVPDELAASRHGDWYPAELREEDARKVREINVR